MRSTIKIVLAASILFLGFTPTWAAVISYQVVVEIVQVDDSAGLYGNPIPTGTFVTGDKIIYTFSINDGAVDSSDSYRDDYRGKISGGLYADAVSDLTVSTDGGNIGTWDPSILQSIVPTTASWTILDSRTSTGSPSYNDHSVFSIASNCDRLALGCEHVTSIALNFVSAPIFTDTGSGQTLAEQTGGNFDLLAFDMNFEKISVRNAFSIGISDGGSCGECYFVSGDILSIQVVPVPAAVWLLGSGLALLGFVRRKKLLTA